MSTASKPPRDDRRVQIPVNTADGAAVPSPCISVCQMSAPTAALPSLCEGCGRTLDEIASWSVMSDDDKLDVWDVIGGRLTQLTATVR